MDFYLLNMTLPAYKPRDEHAQLPRQATPQAAQGLPHGPPSRGTLLPRLSAQRFLASLKQSTLAIKYGFPAGSTLETLKVSWAVVAYASDPRT